MMTRTPHINGSTNGQAGPPPDEEGYLEGLLASEAARQARGEFGPGATEPEEVASLLEFPRDVTLDVDWNDIVEGVFGPGDLMALYGPSGAGKTFIALALAFAIAPGVKIGNKDTRKTAVLYVGYEGRRGIRKRLIAARDEYGDPGEMFARITVAAPLDRGVNGKKGAEQIIRAVAELKQTCGANDVLVIIDTLSRAIAGDDESAAKDMSAFIEHRAGLIAKAGAAVMCVHHSGKDEARGMRGSNSLYAACDAVIEVGDDSIILKKVKDGPEGPWLGFSLRVVEIGTDARRGQPITTCVVDFSDRIGSRKPKKRTLSDPQRRALRVLENMYHDGEAIRVNPAEIGLKGVMSGSMPQVVTLQGWRAACRRAGLSPTEQTPDTARKHVARVISELAKFDVHVCFYGDYVWLPGVVSEASQGAGHDRTNRDNVRSCPGGESADGQPDGHGHPPIGVSSMSGPGRHPDNIDVFSLASPSRAGQGIDEVKPNAKSNGSRGRDSKKGRPAT